MDKLKIWVENIDKPLIMLHSGAGRVLSGYTREKRMQRQQLLADFTQESYKILLAENSRKAVLHALIQMENQPDFFNAGIGSKLQMDGKVRVSAAMMDGSKQKISAVYNAEELKNPSIIADFLLEKRDRNVDGTGSDILRIKLGIGRTNLVTEKQLKLWQKKIEGKTGTVGAVAIDKNGNLFAGTSTGGKGFEFPGRVSDTPTPAGNFATPNIAISATGKGEQILDINLCGAIAYKFSTGETLFNAIHESLMLLPPEKTEIGIIAITNTGDVGFAFTSEGMNVGIAFGKNSLLML